MSFLTLLPMAFVMIAGPQILSAVFLATSERWQRNSLAYILGAAVSISLVVAAAYLLGNGASADSGPSDAVYLVIIVLLVVAMLRTYLKREESALLPKVRDWMNDNSWVVNEIVLAFFVLISIDSLA